MQKREVTFSDDVPASVDVVLLKLPSFAVNVFSFNFSATMKIPLISWVGFDFIVDLSCYTSVRMGNVFAGHSMNCFKCTSPLDSCGISSFLD